MAQTKHLPIYKASYDLRLCVRQAVAKFARSHRKRSSPSFPPLSKLVPILTNVTVSLAEERLN